MRIAIIEDNESVAKGIAYRLQDRGHAADIVIDGNAAEDFLRSDHNDIVILDINLPGLDGLTLLKGLRDRGDNRPVLLLTAKSETEDRVKGLNAGADDYLVKPFDMDELEARIRALSRRVATQVQAEINLGQLRFLPDQRMALIDDEPLELPRRELALLEALLRAGESVMSKTRLIETLYGTGADVSETAIEAHISRLRKKIAPAGLEIRMMRNIGYLIRAGSD
jgi:two-component system OmpR family response regulator